jgi:hypothetical protein
LKVDKAAYLQFWIFLQCLAQRVRQREILKRVLVFNVQKLPRVLQQLLVHVEQEISIKGNEYDKE